MPSPNPLSLGIDFGTTGARAIVLNAQGTIVTQSRCQYPTQRGSLTDVWQTSLWTLLTALPQTIRQQIGSIAIDGTSATVILANAQGQPITDPILYHDPRGRVCLPTLEKVAPSDSPALSATSSLAKVLWWQQTLSLGQRQSTRYLMHQADWLAFLLHGQPGVSDYHNALKLGYDVDHLCYPDWLLALPIAQWVPKVLEPGVAIATIKLALSNQFDIPKNCLIKAGTTDSIAAFLASGAQQPGEAVTSLGSTVVLKLLSTQKVDAAAQGIYSHRLGPLWLVGGASNSGGAVLRHYFTDHQLQTLSAQIDPSQSPQLNYYPLLAPGERFPINDPHYPPRLTPRPSQPATFLHGLLEGIAQIEALGYQQLGQLGATPLSQVWTAGGGAHNPTWQTIRQHLLNVPTAAAAQTDAAYGTAHLAQSGLPTQPTKKAALP